MKLKRINIISLFLFLILILSFTQYAKSYYGDGDCTDYHMGDTINVYYDSNAKIKLDGIANESFWKDSNDEVGTTKINVSTNTREITTLNMSFVRNDNYLFILCEWKDFSTLPDTKDGFFVCWNISAPNFSAYYPGGMDTSHMGGGYIDSWIWTINNEGPVNDSNEYIKDRSYGPGGDTGENDLLTVQLGYSTMIDSKYTIEIRRKLTTSDKTLDVQFNQTGKYGFNLGILNDSALNHDHAISYTHFLNFTFKDNGLIDGFLLIPLLLGISFISIIYIFTKTYKIINKIK